MVFLGGVRIVINITSTQHQPAIMPDTGYYILFFIVLSKNRLDTFRDFDPQKVLIFLAPESWEFFSRTTWVQTTFFSLILYIFAEK